MFPEEVYADTSLGGLKIMTLREKTDNEKAQILSKWLIGAFCHKRLGVVCWAAQWTQPLIFLALLRYPNVLRHESQISLPTELPMLMERPVTTFFITNPVTMTL